MPIKLQNSFVGLTFFFCLLFTSTQTLAATGAIDQTIHLYKDAAAVFGEKIKVLGVQLLFILATLQFALNGLSVLLKDQPLETLIHGLVWSIISVSFFYLIIHSSSTYLPMVIDSFELIGQQGSGLTELTPSAVFSQGIDLQETLVTHFNKSTGADQGLFAALKNFLPALLLTLACIVILISFAVLAWQMALVQIQGYFWLALTPLLQGFGGISYTRDIAIGSLKGGIVIGMKIVCVYLISSIAGEFAPVWGSNMQYVTLENWAPIWEVCFGAGLLAYLSFQLPKFAGDLLNGTSSLSAGDAGTNMMMGGAAAVGTIAGIGGAAAAVKEIGSKAYAGPSGLAEVLAAGIRNDNPGTPSFQNQGNLNSPSQDRPYTPFGASGSISTQSNPLAASISGPSGNPNAAETIANQGDTSTAPMSENGHSSAPIEKTANKPGLQERMRNAAHTLPQDATTVGLNAHIPSQLNDKS
jgi:type IV secretion system protein TrbL